ncbi:MAG TPA: hypothetical protein VFA71_14175 [Terriglobales bacterium]|nr:hypothetical protein [Terriglobales bacterium]
MKVANPEIGFARGSKTADSFSIAGEPARQENLKRIFLFWLAFSGVLLWLGPFANYSPAGWLDPWLYTGYFTNFHDMVHRFGLRYYAARLPYVLFGVLMYKVFSPLAANYLINVAILSADTFSLYAILTRHAGRWAAATGTIALACNPYLIGTITWDYPDGPAIAFLLLGFWMVLAPPQRWEGKAATVAAGAFWAMAGFTNLISGLVIIPGVIILLYIKRVNLREALKQCAWLAMGVVLITAVFGVISLFVFHTFVFWMPQWNMYRTMTTTKGLLERMWGTRWAWIPTSHRVAATYGLALIGGIFFLRYFRQLKRDRFFVMAFLLLALSDLVFAFVEFGMNGAVLRVFYTSSYLLAPAFIFLGALLAACYKIAQEQGTAWQRATLAMAVAGVILPFFIIKFLLRWQQSPGMQWAVLLLISLVGLVAASLPAKGRRIGIALAAFCFALVVSFSTSVNMAYVFFNNRIEFKAALATQDLLMAGLVKDRPLVFWYDNDEPWSPLYTSIAMLYVWDYHDLTPGLATMPVEELRGWILPDAVIIHLTTVPEKVPQRTRLLAQRNIKVEDIGYWTVRREHIEFRVYAQHVLNASEVK